MSQNNPQQPAAHVHVHQSESNSLGTASFVLSLIGWFTCGLLCPIGLILGLIGLGRQPKGLAMAGVIIGALGTVVPLIVFLIFGTAILAMCGLGAAGLAQLAEQQQASRPAADAIYQHYQTNGSLPDGILGTTIVSGYSHDGQDFRYRAGSLPDSFYIQHPGRDGQWDTADDWETSWDLDFDFTGPSQSVGQSESDLGAGAPDTP